MAIRNGGDQVSQSDYGLVTDAAEREQTPKTTTSREGRTSLSEPASTEASDESTSLSKDVIFDIIKNRRRRLVLDFLRNRQTTTLPDLAEHVAAVENEKEIRRLTSSERKRVYVGLYQCHLPKLADAGVIDYNPDRKTIELRERSSQLYPYLDLDPRGRLESGDTDNGLIHWLTSLTGLLPRR